VSYQVSIRVSMDVTIDPVAWADEYGLEVEKVPADIRETARGAVQYHLERLGFQVTVDAPGRH
jgi:hypothetical protein